MPRRTKSERFWCAVTSKIYCLSNSTNILEIKQKSAFIGGLVYLGWGTRTASLGTASAGCGAFVSAQTSSNSFSLTHCRTNNFVIDYKPQPRTQKLNPSYDGLNFWLGYTDSNRDIQSQSLLCYHYTIPQFAIII